MKSLKILHNTTMKHMEKYLVITNTSSKDEIEYVIEREVNNKEVVFTLRHHDTNDIALRITDTGDGLIFGKKIKQTDYSKQTQILILLDFMNRLENIKLYYRFVKDQSL